MRWLALLILVSMPTLAQAEPNMSVWLDHGNGLERVMNAGTTVFDLVITLDTDGASANYAEWAVTNVPALYPGVFILSREHLGNPILCGLDGCLEGPGYFSIPFTTCNSGGSAVELARLRYGDFSALIDPSDPGLLLTLGPVPPGQIFPFGFPDTPGFIDCDGVRHEAEMGGSPVISCSCNGAEVPAGSAIILPAYCNGVETETAGISLIKSRY